MPMDKGPSPVIENTGEVDEERMEMDLEGHGFVIREWRLAIRWEDREYLLDRALKDT